ncbi:MAG: MurR/RpiR family transcriptional regulator [Streptococcaceae bacterium]|jgi:DNA-binding MurR/RpiR family transcriptional regulator|nr:MurR/RpiR family transcriptional regulator [Streptococcaceae bacterium]
MGILLETFEPCLKNLTHTELDSFVKLDNQPDLLLTKSLSALTESLFVSQSSLIRLAQKLGFSGFTDFHAHAKKLLTQADRSMSETLIEQYHSFYTEVLPTIGSQKLEAFAHAIHTAKNIFIVGVGLSKPVAEYMAKHLYQLDRSAVYVYETHMLDLLPNLVTHGDLVFFISLTGETATLVNSAKKVARTGATLLTVTNATHNSLNFLAHQALTTRMPENYYHNYDITTRVFQMTLIDLILDIYLNKYLI